MLQFSDLPIDLLPFILRHIVKPSHLAQCCLVNSTFSSFAIPQLYERIYIYAWHKHGKLKVINLFRTLAARPDLAKWVKKLELRDFPKAISSSASHESLISSCLMGLANCTNLHSCTWTRDQTLSTEILDVLSSSCPSLKELEINGHAAGSYNPQILLQFTSLTKISLIMPSLDVINFLPHWMQKTGETLTAFHVVCKATPLITDLTLKSIGQYMTQLKHLHIAGCPKVTHQGVLSVLHNSERIESLGLEGLSSLFDFSVLTEHARPFTSLTSITLTLSLHISTESWSTAFRAFTAHSPLAEIYLYPAGRYIHSFPHTDFVGAVLELHANTLRKISFHRLILQPELVEAICNSCPNLESLFVVAGSSSLDRLIPALARSKSVRNIHVNFPHIGDGGRIPASEVLRIASQLGPQVRQLGFANRVYQLERIMRPSEANEITTELVLAPYEHPEVPEQFLVVRA